MKYIYQQLYKLRDDGLCNVYESRWHHPRLPYILIDKIQFYPKYDVLNDKNRMEYKIFLRFCHNIINNVNILNMQNIDKKPDDLGDIRYLNENKEQDKIWSIIYFLQDEFGIQHFAQVEADGNRNIFQYDIVTEKNYITNCRKNII